MLMLIYFHLCHPALTVIWNHSCSFFFLMFFSSLRWQKQRWQHWKCGQQSQRRQRPELGERKQTERSSQSTQRWQGLQKTLSERPPSNFKNLSGYVTAVWLLDKSHEYLVCWCDGISLHLLWCLCVQLAPSAGETGDQHKHTDGPTGESLDDFRFLFLFFPSVFCARQCYSWWWCILSVHPFLRTIILLMWYF